MTTRCSARNGPSASGLAFNWSTLVHKKNERKKGRTSRKPMKGRNLEVVGAKGFEPSTSWSRTRASKNLKSYRCRTYHPDTLQNLPSVGPHGTQAFGLMDGSRRGPHYASSKSNVSF